MTCFFFVLQMKDLLSSGEYEYELYLRYDLYTKRNTQWFYFRLQNIRANKRYRFTIVNFFKVNHEFE
jgi:hypothetical protein